MIIFKKDVVKVFEKYAQIVFRQCGRELNHKQKALLKREIEKEVKKNSLWGKIKGFFAKIKENYKSNIQKIKASAENTAFSYQNKRKLKRVNNKH